MNRAAAVVGLALASAPIADAAAFELMHTRDGTPVRWTTLPAEYRALFVLGDPAGERFAFASRAALDRWSSAEGTLASAKWRGPEQQVHFGDGRSTIAIMSPWDPLFGDATRIVAHTLVCFDASTGAISESDVLLNGQGFSFGGGENGTFDLESVIVHESGHLFGMAHPCGDPGTAHPSCFSLPFADRDRILNAVMAPGLAPTVLRREHQADDLAGIAALYPGARSGAAIAIDGIERSCSGDRLEIHGTLPPAIEVELRYADGTTSTTAVTGGSIAVSALATDRGTVDLIVAEPGATRRAIVIDAARPVRDCTAMPPPADGGCACSGTRGSPSMLVLAIGMLLAWSSRRR